MTAAAGLPGRRGHRRAEDRPASRTSPGGQRRTAVRRGRRVHRATGSRPRRCAGARASSTGPGAELAAVVLNSGGANACTGPDGYADTVATAEHLGALLATPAAPGRGRLHRADRPAAADGPAAARRRRGGRGAVDADGGLDAATAIMTTDSVPKTAQVTRRRVHRRRDGQGRRHARPRPGHDAGRADHRRGRRLRRAGHRAARRDPGVASTGWTPTAPCPPTTPCCCSPPARPGSSRRPRLLGAAVTRVCTDLAEQLLADAEGATKEIAIEVRARRHRGRRGRGRPRGRPEQPGEDRVLRPGRQLGPDPGRRRHRRAARAPSTPTRSTWPSTGSGSAAPAPPATTGTASTSPAARCTCVIDLHAGTETATILTNDLSHAYVHENSAYST